MKRKFHREFTFQDKKYNTKDIEKKLKPKGYQFLSNPVSPVCLFCKNYNKDIEQHILLGADDILYCYLHLNRTSILDKEDIQNLQIALNNITSDYNEVIKNDN